MQITAILPLHYLAANAAPDELGLGDVELGIKHRIASQREGHWMPDIAVHPVVRLPTGSSAFGSGKLAGGASIWAQKDFAAWSLFGGGGYTINPGAGNRDFTLAGLALTRQIDDRLNIGGEVVHQGADTIGGSSAFRIGLGATYAISDKLSLLASAARGLRRPGETGRYTFYLGLMVSH